MVATYTKKQHHIHIKMFKTVRLVCGVNIGTQDITTDPIFSPDDMHFGTCLGMEYHADTSCVNKHKCVESVLEGINITNSFWNHMFPWRKFISDAHQNRNLNIALSLTSRMSTNVIPTRYPTIFMLSI